jgi:GntR family transcriptional repressor for pyruvate dehydrogenase complex
VTIDQAVPSLSPLRVPRASDLLAEELRERIFRGEVPVASALPSMRALMAQTQLSRSTVHEALRILEIQGLVEIRTGCAGGTFVKDLGQDAVADTLTLLLRGRRIDMVRMLEARSAMEPSCAVLAALHRSAADLVALDRANEAMAASESLAAFLDASIAWHVAVARASGNEILGGFLQAVSRSVYAAAHSQGFADDEVRRVTERAHRRITDAIRDQDPDAARRRMARHLHAYAEAFSA